MGLFSDSFLGAFKTLSLVDGALVVGTWQSVLFVELDGPRRRRVSVQITGTA
ncbi:YjbQ family protein [Nitrosomonas halophila]|uniref:YjbQ family protein n=1 Tax=Nitrosomonas halophila TaxID=44576 RepID=UPI000B81154C